ncbi:MAG TPA: hypothetical protein VGV59_09010 [Pyrinomonadaceae bacterium]|nr:hypothetical protein [Pyrinomonadaceae bacterium]
MAETSVVFVLRAALLVALVWAAWSVYRRLPEDNALLAQTGQAQATSLRVRLRRVPTREAHGKTAVELYPVDVESVEREYESERRPGLRLEQFIARRMGNVKPITGELDERGEAVLAVPPGRWWLRASVGGVEELSWHLPVNVSGREKTVELNPDNVYTRARSY